VVTSTLIFEGEGRITEYTGGYEDWVRQRAAAAAPVVAEVKPAPKPAPSAPQEKPAKFLKREQRELDEMPEKIDRMETELGALNAQLWDPDVYKQQPENVPQLKAELAALEERIRQGYARWEELETRRKAGDPEAA
jgi:ATP-binding cassette subfamily F protein uup